MSQVSGARDEGVPNTAPSHAKFRACWVPQLGKPAFEREAPSYRHAQIFIDVLSEYENYLLAAGLRTDDSNIGFIEWNHPTETGGEWEELEDWEAVDRGIA